MSHLRVVGNRRNSDETPITPDTIIPAQAGDYLIGYDVDGSELLFEEFPIIGWRISQDRHRPFSPEPIIAHYGIAFPFERTAIVYPNGRVHDGESRRSFESIAAFKSHLKSRMAN